MSLVVIIAIVILILISGLRVVTQYQRIVVFRLGRFQSVRDPGLQWIIPFIDFARFVDVRVVTLNVEPQETMTKDNVPVRVRAVVWYRVKKPMEALVAVESFQGAVIQTSLT